MSQQTRPRPTRPGGPPAAAAAPQRESRMRLSSIHRGTRAAPDRILLVGVEGVGKSTFGADAPDPVFIAAEDGIRHLDVASFPEPKVYQDVLDAVAELTAGEHAFKTLVVDTVDWLEPLIADAVCAKNNWENPETPGYGKGWVAIAGEWRRWLLQLDRLREARGMEIILLAHATMRTVPNPLGPDYARFEGKLNKSALALVKEWTDCNLFATHEEYVAKARGEMRAKATVTGKRIIHTVRSAGWDAKNRHGLPEELPLDYAAYAEARAAGQPQDPTALWDEAQQLLALIPDEKARTTAAARLEPIKGDAARLARAVNALRSRAPAPQTTDSQESA